MYLERLCVVLNIAVSTGLGETVCRLDRMDLAEQDHRDALQLTVLPEASISAPESE